MFSVTRTKHSVITNGAVDPDAGNILEHQCLVKNQWQIRTTSNTSTDNEIGRLFQGFGQGEQKGQITKRTNSKRDK